MAKKALWGIAGLAVIVILGVVYFNGTRSVSQGAEGTIAAANRAVGAQPSSVNAKAGDAQAFHDCIVAGGGDASIEDV